MDSCDNKDTNIFNSITDLDFSGCLFKKHCPEY